MDFTSNEGSEEQPYSADELQRLTEIGLTTRNADIVRACLLTLQAANVSLPELCRRAIETHPNVSFQAWRAFGPHGCMEVLRSLVNHPERQVRESAVENLRYVDGKEAIPLGKPLAVDRTVMCLLLGRDIPAAQMPYVASLLNHPDATLRHIVHQTLARSAAGADALYAELTRHQDSYLGLTKREVILEIIGLLSTIKDNRARDFLIRSARYGWYEISDASFKALRSFSMEGGVESLIESFRDADNRVDEVATLFKNAGEKGAERLLDLFRHDETFRRHGGELLARVVGDSAIPSLMDALESPFREIRKGAYRGLRILGAPAARALDLRLPGMLDMSRRNEALRHLWYVDLTTPETYKIIAEMIARPSTQMEALNILGKIESPACYTLLLDLLSSELIAVANLAINTCTSLMKNVEPPLEFISAVARLAEQTNRDLQCRALNLLVYVYNYAFRFNADIKNLVSLFVRLLGSQDTEVVGTAIEVLKAQYDTELIDSVIAAGAPNIDALQQARESILRRKEREEARRAERLAMVASDDFSPGYTVRRPIHHMMTNMSVTAPRVVVPMSRFLLVVWVHEKSNNVVTWARQMASGKPITLQTKRSVQIPDKAVLNVVIDLPGFELEEEHDTIFWKGGLWDNGNCTFAVTVPRNAIYGTHLGKASIWLSDVRIAKLDFALEVGPEDACVEDLTVDEHFARTAFASYASQELSEVLARIQGMQKILPDLDVFLDIVSLRSGEDWKKRLTREIADRDLFLLFWSLAASRSEWVQREWQTALETKGLEGINPVPLEPPAVAPPPSELSSLHFNDWTLAVSSRSREPRDQQPS